MGGGGSQVTGYNYQTALIIGICEGPVSNTGVVWNNKERTTLTALNLSFFQGESAPAAAWGYLTTNHSSEAIRYPGLCYVCSPLFDLKDSADVPNLTFEVVGAGRLGTFKDAQPDFIIDDFITNVSYGAAPDFSLGSLTAYGDYCRALGLFISPAFTEQKEAAEYLKDIAQCTNSEFVWSQGVLKLIPYADSTVTGNGYTYTPDLTPVYDLTDDDFCSVGEDPVKCSRITTADAYNHVQVEFVNRNKDYNVEIAEAKDQADIEAKGLRTKDPVKLHYICEPSVARTVAQLILQRELYVRNTYQFRLSSWRHCLLEPMDLVTITDTAMGLDKIPVRIREIEEDEDDYLNITADEWPFGVGSVALYPHQDGQGYVPNYQVAPGNANTPAIFEPPFRLTDNSLEVWLATSGGPNWGGCEVWVSRDGATYAKAGTIAGGQRHGTLVNTLPTGSALDTVNTMRAQLLDNSRQLLAATQLEADELRTLMWVDGELIAYQNAALVSSGVYDLTYLVRGAHNSVIGAHAAGTKWARLDGSLFRVPILPTDIGKTIYIKLCSYNIYGVSLQTPADVSAFTYAITGYARQRLPVDITAPATPTVTTSTNNTYPYTGHLILSWGAVSGINKYVVRYKKNTDTQWEETPVASGTTWKSPELPSGGTYDVAVASEDENGFLSAWTAGAQTAIPYNTTAPATPGAVTITPGIGFLVIQWPANTDVDIAGYELQIAPDNSGAPGTWATVYTGPNNTHTYRGTPGNIYWAKVRAFDKYPGTPKYSSYNGQTSATVDFMRALDAANVPSGYNLQINSDFDAGTLDGWALSSWGSLPSVVTATTPRSGKYAIRNAANTTASIKGTRMIPCNPGRAYVLEGYATTISGTTGTFFLRVYFFTAAGSATTPDYIAAAEAVTPGATPTFYSKVFGAGQTDAIPTGAVYMQPVVILNYNNATRIMEAQGIRIREVIEAAYIKDLAVTQAKIANGAVGTLQVQDASITQAKVTGLVVGDAGITMGPNATISWSKITSPPTSLSGINSAEGSKLAGIASGASSDIQLVGSAGMSVVGNSATKVSGTNWNEQVYSQDAYTGGAFCSFSPNTTNRAIMCGLNSDPTTDASVASLDFAWYVKNSGTVLEIYESGVSVYTAGTYTTDSVLSIIYDGSTVKYYHNGTLAYTSLKTIANNLRLSFDSSFCENSGSIRNIKFGPLSSNYWTNIGGRPNTTYIDVNGVYTGLVVADQVQTGGLRGINVNAASHTTKGSFLTQACTAGATTLYVHNTADFPASGSGWIIDSTNDRDEISWTGKTATTLTGVSGVLAHGSGVTIIPKVKNLLIDSVTNEMRFYADVYGSGVISEVMSLGLKAYDADYTVIDLNCGDNYGITIKGTNRFIYAIEQSSAYYSDLVYVKSVNAYSVPIFGESGGVDSSAAVLGKNTGGGTAAGVMGWVTTGKWGVLGRSDATTYCYDFYANGAATNYGPFTGSHDGLVLKGFSADIGDILIDYKVIERANCSNGICENRMSSIAKQKGVIGVYIWHAPMDTKSPPSALWDKELMLPNPAIVELCEIYDVVNFNAVGEGMINVCKDGGNITAGDYICTSSRPGKGMKQDDDFLHNYTVAKAREDCIWLDTEDDIRMIACTYHCG